MKNETPDYIQDAVDNVMAAYDRYLSGKLNLKALDPISILDLERDFLLADKHLDYINHRQLSAMRRYLSEYLLK
jgi:hypothetical protein